jgi:ribosomal protein S18 acetylase RimI-like enzyme
MTPALVRPYRAADREQVLELAPRLTEGVAPWRDPAAVSRAVHGWMAGSLAAADEPGHAVFVAELGGRVAGVITVAEHAHFTGQVDAYVGELAVAADLERRGIATQLVSAAESWAARRGLAFLTLETGAANEPARKLYAALGFLAEDVRLTKPAAAGE